MTAYLKELESKKETTQIGIFDLGNTTGMHATFTLATAKPMTFEEKIKGEKETIGYPVSGHPLSGLEEYIRQKSKNMGMILEWKKHLLKAEEANDAIPIHTDESADATL